MKPEERRLKLSVIEKRPLAATQMTCVKSDNVDGETKLKLKSFEEGEID